MTDKELRKLGRRELLTLLLNQSRELDRVRSELEAARAELENRRLTLEESGSIAQASLQLNGVFEAAQKAADEYVESVRAKYDKELDERVLGAKAQEAWEELYLLSQELCESAERVRDILSAEFPGHQDTGVQEHGEEEEKKTEDCTEDRISHDQPA